MLNNFLIVNILYIIKKKKKQFFFIISIILLSILLLKNFLFIKNTKYKISYYIFNKLNCRYIKLSFNDIKFINNFIYLNRKNILGFLISIKYSNYLINNKNYVFSLEILNFIRSFLSDNYLKFFIDIKIIKIFLFYKKYINIFNVIKKIKFIKNNNLNSLKFNLLGDIYYQLNFLEKAKYYWFLSLNLNKNIFFKHLIKLKLNNLKFS